MFINYNLLQKSSKRYSKDILVHCYISYSQYDFILGYMFFQVFINNFIIHNMGYANINFPFNQQNYNRIIDHNNKNQIENYLDGAFDEIYKAESLKSMKQ